MLNSVIAIDGEAYIEGDVSNKRQIKTYLLSKLKECSGKLDSSVSGAVMPDDPAIIMFTSVYACLSLI